MSLTGEGLSQAAGWPGIQKLGCVQDILNKNKMLIAQARHPALHGSCAAPMMIRIPREVPRDATLPTLPHRLGGSPPVPSLQIHHNHELRTSESLQHNVTLLRELNANIARVVQSYAELAVDVEELAAHFQGAGGGVGAGGGGGGIGVGGVGGV